MDTIFPVIDMTETLTLGETVYYELTDYGSGLSIYRAVIEDDAEQYKKIVWLNSVSGNKLQGDILWDGKFADGTQAGIGEYFITLKISDAAGNKTIKSAIVSVNALSFLQVIPAFTLPPSIANEMIPTAQIESTPSTTSTMLSAGFGGQVNPPSDSANTTTMIEVASAAKTSPIPNSTILWGAAASALVGATLADWQRKREEELKRKEEAERKRKEAEEAEEERKRKEAAEAEEERRRKEAEEVEEEKPSGYRAKIHAKNVRAINLAGEQKRDALLALATQGRREQSEQRVEAIETKLAREDAAEEARWAAVKKAEEKRKAAELQAGLSAYYEGRKAGEEKSNTGGSKGLAMPVEQDDPPNWWETLVFDTKKWVNEKIDKTWPALRASGPGTNGISIVNENKTIINMVVSSFNSLVTSSGGIPYEYEKKNGDFEQATHSTTIHPTSIAISLSLQSEAPHYVDFFQWILNPIGKLFDIGGLSSPSYGMAQINPDKYSLIKENIQPYTNLDGVSSIPFFALNTPQVSTAAMIERVAPAVEICEAYNCTPTDKEIVIALAQNGDGFNTEDLKLMLKNGDYKSDNSATIINWQDVFNERNAKNDETVYNQFLNWRASDHNFDTWFMLNRYYNNAMAFEASGEWSMPQGVDWEYINSLIENTPPSGQ